MLIALATSDGKVINQHFGKCRVFSIVEIDETHWNWHFVEQREQTPPCQGGDHSDPLFAESIEVIRDCGAVFVSRIGPFGKSALNRQNIQVLEISGIITEVIDGYIAYLMKQKDRRSRVEL